MNKSDFSNIRKSLDLTQIELADVLCISIKTIQAYEQGRSNIPNLVSKTMQLMHQNIMFRGVFYSHLKKMRSFTTIKTCKSCQVTSPTMEDCINCFTPNLQKSVYV